MKKVLVLKTAALLASILVAGQAQARNIFWTGQGSGVSEYDCQRDAIGNGLPLIRQDCVRNKGYTYDTCEYAPFAGTQLVSQSYYNGQYSCQYRVFISVP